MIWLYRLLFVPVFVVMFPYYALRMLKRGGYAKDFSHRFGMLPTLPKKSKDKKRIWIQAVSVGEVDAVIGFVKKLEATQKYEVVLTTTTSTAYALLNNKYKDDCLFHAIFPIDFFPFSYRAWETISPDAVILMEGEVWPEHLHQAKIRKVPAILINARLSDKSYSRYNKIRILAQRMFNKFSKICVSNEVDYKRFEKLGIDKKKLELTGNIKFDVQSPKISEQEKQKLKLEMGFAPDSFVLLGSSTWKGEERMLVETTQLLRDKGVDCRLLLVPRHAERRNEIKPEIEHLPHCVRTEQKQAKPDNIVYLADTTGELRMFTAIADLVFVGKSLFDNDGGQSPIDAAAAGIPIVYGNNMTNFKQICKSLESAGASRKVYTAEEGIKQLITLALDENERHSMSRCAVTWHANNEGATTKTLDVCTKLL